MNELKPFKFWCQKVLPLVYDDSLSYQELLCKVVDYLNNTMENVNELNENYITLKNFVDNYFNTLDVQDEINNKLDEMASNGTLSQLIAPLINAQSNPTIVNSVNDMTDVNKMYILKDTGELYYYNGNWVGTGIIYGEVLGRQFALLYSSINNSITYDYSTRTLTMNSVAIVKSDGFIPITNSTLTLNQNYGLIVYNTLTSKFEEMPFNSTNYTNTILIVGCYYMRSYPQEGYISIFGSRINYGNQIGFIRPVGTPTFSVTNNSLLLHFPSSEVICEHFRKTVSGDVAIEINTTNRYIIYDTNDTIFKIVESSTIFKSTYVMVGTIDFKNINNPHIFLNGYGRVYTSASYYADIQNIGSNLVNTVKQPYAIYNKDEDVMNLMIPNGFITKVANQSFPDTQITINDYSTAGWLLYLEGQTFKTVRYNGILNHTNPNIYIIGYCRYNNIYIYGCKVSVEYSPYGYAISLSCAMFGDSLVAGLGSTIPYECFSTVYGKFITYNYGVAGTGYNVNRTDAILNGGGVISSGGTISTTPYTNDILSTIKYFSNKITPEQIICVQAGTNDFGSQISLETFKQSVENVCNYVSSLGNTLVLCTPFHRSNETGTNNLKSYVDVIIEVAKEKNVYLIDFYNEFYYVDFNNVKFSSDGLHLNTLGAYYASKFFENKMSLFM